MSNQARGAEAPLAADPETVRVIEAALAAVVRAETPQAPPSASWRFSGRWWATPLPLRRSRPGR